MTNADLGSPKYCSGIKQFSMTKNQPLTLTAYQEAAMSADRSRDDTLNVPLLGLFGETGGLLTVAKKKHRDRASFVG
jgi:hypothetical protein